MHFRCVGNVVLGLRRPLIHWKCFDFQVVAAVGRAAELPQFAPVLCRTRSTGVPQVCCDVSVSAISMLIITTIATEFTKCCVENSKVPQIFWNFPRILFNVQTFFAHFLSVFFDLRWFSKIFYRCSCNFVDLLWFLMFSHIFFESMGFHWCAIDTSIPDRFVE